MNARRVVLPLLLASIPALLPAQDTTHVDVHLMYDNPSVRPALVVLPAHGLDSVRALVERDLDQSDRFEMILLPAMLLQADGPLNLAPYRAMNAEFAVELLHAGGNRVTARVHHVPSALLRREGSFALDLTASGEGRMVIHRMADEIVEWMTGSPGIAATRMLFVMNNRVWQVDADGYGLRPLTAAGRTAYSPTWSPDGRRFAFTELWDGHGSIVVQTAATGSRVQVPTTGEGTNITPAFSRDSKLLAFSRAVERGTYALHQANVADLCCVSRLTFGRFADNTNPTYSPDGRRIAFVSSRAGVPQIYVMSVDGTNQELLVPFDYGLTGASFAPEWSPDGLKLVLHRAMAGGFQVMVYDLTTDRVRQVTSEGRNEDASWAPDSRHIVYSSSRTGRRQLHVLDLVTSRVRSIPTPSNAQLASWSPRLAAGSP
jgi:TolB protein